MSILDIDNIAARLRHRVTLQETAETADGAGGVTRSWQDVASVWAEIVPLNGQERLTALQLSGFTTHRITVRYRDDITADKRLLYEGRIFNIRAALNVEERDCLVEMLVEEGVE